MSISADAAPRCQHIKDDGVRCKSPALQSFDFCFWHQRARAPQTTATIPLLDNENAIQIVITQTLQQLQAGTLDTRRATAMFRGLTLAMQNVNKLRSDNSSFITATLTPAMLADLKAAGASHNPASTDSPDQPLNTAAPTDASHEAWKSGASAPRCDAQQNGALAPASQSPDSSTSNGPMTRLPNGPISLKRPSATSSLDPQTLAFAKKVLRAGPSHPKFAAVSRIYDRYISTKQTG